MTVNTKENTMNFKKADIYSRSKGETNDCAVKAVSIACDVPYHVAHKALALQGRQNRRGSMKSWIDRAIQSLGFKTKIVHHSAATVTSLSGDRAVEKGHYVAYVKGHILAIVDGKVEDWTDGKRHRIHYVESVTPAVSRKERQAMKAKLMAQ